MYKDVHFTQTIFSAIAGIPEFPLNRSKLLIA